MLVNPETFIYYFEIWSKAEKDKKPLFHCKKTTEDITFSLSEKNPQNETVLAFSVIEEEMTASIVNISLQDQFNVAFPYFQYGATFYVRWGFTYPKNSFETSTMYFMQDFDDEIESINYRGGRLDDPLTENYGISCFVMNLPSFKMEGTALEFSVTLRCNSHYQRFPNTASYPPPPARKGAKPTETTLKDIIKSVIEDELKVKRGRYIISFPNMNQKITSKNPIRRQAETPTKFLKRLAADVATIGTECKYVYSHSATNRYCIFIDWKRELELNNRILELTNMKSGNYHYFDYGHEKANIITLDGKIEQGTLGSTAVPIISADGKPSMMFLPSGQLQVRQYVYDQNKTSKKLESMTQEQRDIIRHEVEQATSLSDVFDSTGKPFDRFDPFFTKKEDPTARENGGFIVELGVIPDVTYLVGHLAWLGVNKSKVKEIDSLFHKATSLIPELFRTNSDDVITLETVGEDGILKRPKKVNTLSYTYYRIAKTEWSHTGSGVEQKVTLIR